MGTDSGMGFFDQSGALTKTVESPDGLGPTISSLAGNPHTGRIAAIVDGKVFLWDPASGWTPRPPLVPKPSLKPLNASLTVTGQSHETDVREACFSPTGKLLAMLGGDGVLGTAEILDAGNLTQIATLPAKGRLVSASFSSGGEILAVSNSKERVFLWNVAEKRLIATLDPPSGLLGWAAPAGSVLAFAPARQILVSGTGGGPIHFWDVKEGLHIKELDFMRFVFSLSYSRDGKLLVVLLRDGECGELKIIDTSDYAVIASLTPSVSSFAAMCSPVDADLVAIAGERCIQIIRVSDVLRESKKDK